MQRLGAFMMRHQTGSLTGLALVAALLVGVSTWLIVEDFQQEDQLAGVKRVGPCRTLGIQDAECRRQARLIVLACRAQPKKCGRLLDPPRKPDNADNGGRDGATNDSPGPATERGATGSSGSGDSGGGGVGSPGAGGNQGGGSPPGGGQGGGSPNPPSGPPPAPPQPPSPPPVQPPRGPLGEVAKGVEKAVEDVKGGVCKGVGVCLPR